ncbi:MAG: DUF4335 domain-containing protein [Nostocaceae cyanobacterium]|nr:DUF4335 domain-containing protein [Nostocaceae cyanobacterium]
MAVSNPVIRRYTPPTCTLEILAQNSSLSRWTSKSVLKQIHFELRLDDPRMPEEHRNIIRGNGEQLEALCMAVTKYVQEFLQTSSDNFWETFSADKESQKQNQPTPSEDAEDINQSSPKNQVVNFASTQTFSNQIHLQPNGHLTHKLFLGPLAKGASAPVIQLNFLQLFDLANALDEYSTDVMVLPKLGKKTSVLGLPSWAPAAAIVVVALGLTPFTVQYVRDRQQQQIAETNSTPTEAITPESNPLAQISPTPNPGLIPPDNLPSIPSLSSVPGANTTAVPGNPQQSPQTSPGVTPAPTNSSPIASLPSPGVTPQAKQGASQQSVLSQLSQPEISIQSNSGQNSSTSTAKPTATPSTAASLPSTLPSIGSTPLIAKPKETIGRISTPSLPPLNTTELPKSPTTESSVSNDTDALVSKLRRSKDKQNNVATSSGTLFDTTQVAEARDYLKKRWQPPDSLKQALQYSLTVGADGKIKSIFPLNKAARDYIDRSGLPLIDEPFVSANKQAQTIRIRAVLSPDGKVQALPEKE